MFSLAVKSCSCVVGALLGFNTEGGVVPWPLGIADDKRPADTEDRGSILPESLPNKTARIDKARKFQYK